ncbi:nucleotide sugar dehydrogenase [Paenibacillus sp.]|uniref:nucleotide sugar dehydrogenase n=1 Tax=Paenibacillus sp. TaxID=58172 RepID=UPI002D59D366|nr:nucleotide sugar dehydrogenase [Paenibacillus sp.]HZG58286.1 nucleotide sugar dehydrogenase [Paenibacillus sp.]
MNEGLPWKVAVVGLGYVGLPLAIHIHGRGFPVQGFDKDERKIRMLHAGKSYIPDVPDDAVKQAAQSGTFEAAVPSNAIREAEYIIVSVPTPLNRQGHPDLTAVKRASMYVAKHLRPGQTVVFESSTYPGTLEEVILPILNESGLQVGTDYYLGYSPERIDPGNHAFPIEAIPKVVSGLTQACLERVNLLYSRLFRRTVPVSHPKVAEMCKLFENIQRLVNISLVNEIDLICERMDIDFWETLQAASTKPFGFTPYWPGPGIGGHCIPVDPLYFQWKAKQFGQMSRLIGAAHRINAEMPRRIAERVARSIGSAGCGASKGKVLAIGLAYKKDVNDIRESSAVDVFARLAGDGYQMEFCDPHVSDVKVGGKKYVSKKLTPELLRSADAVVILTDHSDIDWTMVRKHAKRIVDTRGVLRRTAGGDTA